MGVYKTIRNEMASVITAIQLSGSSAFQDVQTKPTTEFSGYPAVTILPQSVSSDYITVRQNQRGYGMYVTIYYEINDTVNWQTVIDNMLDLIDATLDALDKTIDLNGKCDFLEAVPADWMPDVIPQGTVFTASIMAVAKKDVSVQ